MKTTSEYREQFESLVAKAEDEIQANPTAYKRKLKYLAFLGYGIIFGLLFLLISIVAGTTWAVFSSTALLLLLLKKKLIFVVLGVIWVLFKSIFVRIEEPEGLELSRQEYPEIWKEVDNLQKKIKTVSIDRLIIIPEMNAAVIQTPKFGIVGPYKNTLMIGFELLAGLSPEQARAVLAHEFAHLSGNHGKFGAWIYRVRLTWFRIQYALEQDLSWGTGFIRKIIDWYTPYFTGYSFVLARDNEYEADAVSAELTTNHTASSALMATHVYSDVTNEYFWKPLYDKAFHSAMPPDDIYGKLESFMQKTFSDKDITQRAISRALKVGTDSSDTHPALIDRLKALKSPGSLQQVTQSAAREWLGSKYDQVVNIFNKAWMDDNEEQWKEFYAEAEQAKVEVEKLKKTLAEGITKDELWRLAVLTEQYLPEEDALILYQNYSREYPDDVDADYAIGRLLIEKDDAEGIPYLEKTSVVETHSQGAAELLWQYYLKTDNEKMAKYWLCEAEAAYDTYLKANEERATPGNAKECVATSVAPLDSELINEIMGKSHLHKKVAEVWLAEKEVEYYKDSPVYLLAYVTKGFSLDDDDLLECLASRIEGSKLVFLITKKTDKKLFNKIKKVGIQVY